VETTNMMGHKTPVVAEMLGVTYQTRTSTMLHRKEQNTLETILATITALQAPALALDLTGKARVMEALGEAADLLGAEGSAEPHKTVKVQVGDREADIDEQIAPLIEEVWKAGIETVGSCQESRPGINCVGFATAADAEKFLDIVTEYEENINSMYNRITDRWWSEEEERLTPLWEYDVYPDDLGVTRTFIGDNVIDDSHDGVPNFLFSVTIRFPRTDYPVLLRRMVRHNRARREP
jgi:hypothetical protein